MESRFHSVLFSYQFCFIIICKLYKHEFESPEIRLDYLRPIYFHTIVLYSPFMVLCVPSYSRMFRKLSTIDARNRELWSYLEIHMKCKLIFIVSCETYINYIFWIHKNMNCSISDFPYECIQNVFFAFCNARRSGNLSSWIM